jgi:hypothetical protein
MRSNLAMLVAAGLALLAASISRPAQAEWSDQVTTHRWDATPSTPAPNGKTGKSQGSQGTPSVGRSAGGWFEDRFLPNGSPLPDVSRANPRTFNEVTTTHRHGTHGTLSPHVIATMRSQSIVYTPKIQIQLKR